MNAEPRTIRTDAEKAITDHFESVIATLPGDARVRARRETAFDRFRLVGLPHRRIEEWKYTDLRALMRHAAAPTVRPDEAAARAAVAGLTDPLAGLERYTLVVVDGFFVEALSDIAALAAVGVEVASTASAFSDKTATAGLFAIPELATADIAVALNTAFLADGVRIRVRDGAVLDKPLEIQHIASVAGAASPRHEVVIGADANLRIFETYHGPDGTEYQVNGVTQISAGAHSAVRYARLQVEGDRAIHIGTTTLSLAPKAEFDHLTVTAGARVSRSQVFLTTGGEHTRAGLFGAGMIGGRQHADVTLLIDHALPGANTGVLYKNVVDDEARGVFQGKIIVEPDAQKTDAKMMSQALLLTQSAEFDAKPELEIFADDVQCGHGATAGQIDETQLFYLMARGVPRVEAEQLLIEAFLDSAIDALGDAQIGDVLKRTVSDWIERRRAKAS